MHIQNIYLHSSIVTIPAVQPPYTYEWKSHLALLGIQALDKEIVR